ncbi:MAG TPA: hypothetical protein VFM18_02600 [Methanosarcina sp.]|nr:hypothetical protein [Methanosarcina sp.]
MSDSILNVSELDFDTIKTNLKDFLRTKPEFTDYDFEGSGLSVLIDVLAYNTHYEAMVANQLAQELTIDTAQNRTIVGLHAKRLGYLPRSYRAAQTTVNLEVVNPANNPSTLTLGKGASFISTVDGSVIEFVNIVPRTISKDANGRYIFQNVEIYQGSLKTFRYVVSDVMGKFSIPDSNVDTSTLRVHIQTSLTNTSKVEYFKVDRITDLGSTSLAYYIQMNQKGQYEIHFGDGILGKQPNIGNVIVLEYVVTDGPVGNDISIITFNDYIEGNSNITLTTNSKTYGGDVAESLDSIRFNAYKNSLTQDRAVTSTDYANLIAELFPLDAISVWGGEQNDPPVYGKVFIAIKPIDSDSVLTQTNKDFISSTLKATKSIVTVTPDFVDVDYLFIEPTIAVYIDETRLNTTPDYIKTIVINAAKSYSTNNLEKFEKVFRFSKFSASIDSSDSSILSNISSLKMTRRFVPLTGVVDSWKINFNNPIAKGSFKSSSFQMQGFSNDLYISDLNGILQISYIENGIQKVFSSNVGTIAYDTGVINLNSLMFVSYTGDYIELTGIPSSPDIISVRNSIVMIDPEKISVSAIIESQDFNDHQFSVTR